MGDEADTALSHVLDIVDINAIAEEQDPCVVLQPSPSSSGAASDGEPVSGASSSTDQGASSSSSSSSPQILLGLWPEAALLNHSCVPNTAIVPVQVRRGKGCLADTMCSTPAGISPLGPRWCAADHFDVLTTAIAAVVIWLRSPAFML
jgi:hypothetical protein